MLRHSTEKKAACFLAEASSMSTMQHDHGKRLFLKNGRGVFKLGIPKGGAWACVYGVCIDYLRLRLLRLLRYQRRCSCAERLKGMLQIRMK
jgi:hypothetical protein